MQPGLHRFGTDWGNGEADRRFFPLDEDGERYLREKSRILTAYPERIASDVRDPLDEAAATAAQRWLSETLDAEGHGDRAAPSLAELGRNLCEDFAVVRLHPSGADRVIHVHACFPSGWRPEHVVGRSFVQVHAAIPAFGAVAAKAPSLVSAMVSRGPYVRFVWTISADAELDHHPDQGKRADWSAHTTRGFLRVERQVTVPLGGSSASVFLIRTYLYPFEELNRDRRHILRRALELMPSDIVRYKRLEGAIPRALELLS